ncbi:hypothetical protein MTO96_027955 [Rhipicephalus appendiculatus]
MDDHRQKRKETRKGPHRFARERYGRAAAAGFSGKDKVTEHWQARYRQPGRREPSGPTPFKCRATRVSKAGSSRNTARPVWSVKAIWCDFVAPPLQGR